ncbi:MAG TPA: N-6 DNA methylase [Pirellulales bacterium]|jgi:hypothetical protein|nr:N-6 DNA methylase [Pirellulales bacterium]
MPLEAKPLFRPDVLRGHLSGFMLPPRVESLRPKLANWAELIGSNRIDALNEQQILPDFLTDFFLALLGYTGPAGGADRYTLSRERHVEIDGKFADAVLGDFNGESRYIVALEGKGPRDPLDRPFAGRRMSAVDQGYRYAINLPCDWIIVTSIRETRLYHKGSNQQTFERFDTEQLAGSDAALLRFVFLLGAERVVPAAGECHFYSLLAESEKVGRELTKHFYVGYANMRQDAFERLSGDNPAIPRHEVLASTQKLLDRVLFVAFSEDRGLLPAETIRKAYEHRDPYHSRPIWDNFRGLFGAINRGNAALGIHAYNGGLFADDPLLDSLQVSDEVCRYFRDLGDYDYRPPHEATGEGGRLIDVDILGHIFEQSITDLERLRSELEGLAEPLDAEKHKTRRKKEGAFYTPSFITRYIIEQALGGVLDDRFDQLRRRHEDSAKGAPRAALADPRVYQLDKLTKPQRAALVKFWEAWQDELTGIRLLDPACGSGAFLIEAFDQLHAEYERSNDRLQELRGHRTLFDLDKRILENNLYGVDLNEEAIEICRLSLWIKTAERGKALTSLDHPIRVGNSVVSDPTVHPKALDWQATFPEVFENGGFDVVVGNPPYVRQESISALKPYLQTAYSAYHGMADLYVYFYELGLRVLKPGGLLSFVVTNKWMKSGYGEPLRRLFAEKAWIESVVDFGHAKQIFVDADVFPSIIVARKPSKAPKPKTARLCSIPREQLRIDDLSRQIESEGVELPIVQLGPATWQLEPGGVNGLISKICAAGVPLSELPSVRLYRGVVTGCNEVFLITDSTRKRIVDSDARSGEIIMPYVRGQDIERWSLDWPRLWMIFTRRGIEIDNYPGVRDYLQNFRMQLDPKPPGWSGGEWPGRKPGTYQWFEIQDSIDYWREFSEPKIMYQDIAWRPQFCLDKDGRMSNNTVHFIVTDDKWLLATLNSPVAWWYSWRSAQHGKDEALRLFSSYMRSFPVPTPSDEKRKSSSVLVDRISARSADIQVTRRTILDWLRVEYEIAKPSMKLQSPVDLDSDAFVAEVRKVRGKKNPLSAAALKNVREEHARTIEPARALAAESLSLERQISDLVNEAYGLTPEEIALLWQTAPPRMPFV